MLPRKIGTSFAIQIFKETADAGVACPIYRLPGVRFMDVIYGWTPPFF